MVERAGQPDGPHNRDALSALVVRYTPALKTYLVRSMGLDVDHAEDVLQQFILTKLVEQEVIRSAEQARGRFRSFLVATLERFALNLLRYDRAKVRRPEKLLALEEGIDKASGVSDPAVLFDLAWAREVLAQAVVEMQEQCSAAARPDLWAVFEGRVLGPTLHMAAPVSYAELIRTCGFASPAQASNALVTATRTFKRALRAVISRYIPDDRDVDEELADLQKILSSHGARSL
jgi:RNA polymerase sigma-70 factor (ECF subfamily)